MQTVLQQTITNADTKTSVLVAALAVLFATDFGGSPVATLIHGESVVQRLGALLVLASLAAVLVAGGYLVWALFPRLGSSGNDKELTFSRFALPDIARTDPDDLALMDHDRRPLEAWRQARNLAEISVRKHSRVQRGLGWAAAGVCLRAAAWLVGGIGAAVVQ